ncbi:MAG: tRNA 5-hydroxyuridine modification protein YegQ [Candidatus Marinimicrobia bacterium]|nr:tRNA 5-hydroxyuridine modification protein YegQ [Candidatus Neomarinimicrobiota bacterium]
MKLQKPELLIPAGDFEKLKYAFAFGTDAVYAGIPLFSLRTREIGFTQNNIQEAIEYTHKLGKKIYLVMNIYAHNMKVNPFLNELERVVAMKPDALIMTDPGLINIALQKFPNMDIHLSTQANTTNWASVKFWRDLGIKRIILTRELSLKEIAEMHKQVPDIELEAFVHGAICIAYSGRCLISNYLNHRDANQGTCTNSCRWEYKLGYEKGSLLEVEKEQKPYSMEEYSPPPTGFYVKEQKRVNDKFPILEDEYGTYMMNSKDLCSIELLSDLAKAGVVSFKAEGRTKSVYYSAMVSRAYRRAIDDFYTGKKFDPENLRDLMALSSRTYTTGFYTRNPRQFGENFEDGYSQSRTHKVAGIIRNYNPKKHLAEIEIKNRIDVGNEIEIITPEYKKLITVKEIINKKDIRVESAHGGAENVFIPLENDPGEFAFLRKSLATNEN